MKRLLLLSAPLLALAAPAAVAGPPEAVAAVTVTARRLLDVESGRLVENAVVRIEGA